MGAKRKYPNRHGPHFLVRIHLKFEMLSSYSASLWISRFVRLSYMYKITLKTIKQANSVADAPQWNNPGFPRCSVSGLGLYYTRLHVNSSLFPWNSFQNRNSSLLTTLIFGHIDRETYMEWRAIRIKQNGVKSNCFSCQTEKQVLYAFHRKRLLHERYEYIIEEM